jgi:hypothetical protein
MYTDGKANHLPRPRRYACGVCLNIALPMALPSHLLELGRFSRPDSGLSIFIAAFIARKTTEVFLIRFQGFLPESVSL